MSGSHWFEPLADHMGEAYLRYSFTMGTGQEVDYLVDALGLSAGSRILDVGCGPGRHAHEFARRGMSVHGIDIAQRFVDIANEHAPEGATFERMDARSMPFSDEFDAVVCLCQGAFGLMTADGDDETVLAGMSTAIREGGRLALSAFSSYFVMKHWEGAVFDADLGVNHEHTEIKSETGEERTVDLWTGCYTPRELRLLADRNDLDVDAINSVEPGAYVDASPTADTAEFLLLATKR